MDEKTNERSFTGTFLKGLAVVLPVAILFATLLWIGKVLESVLGRWLKPFVPEDVYFPGAGLLFGVILCFLVGLLMNTTIASRAVQLWHRILERIPLIKSLYGAVEDILGSFSQDRKKRFNRVVKIRFPASDLWLIGFVTREDLSELPDGLNRPEEVAVYLPMSYQIGGYMIFIPKSQIAPLDISIEDASRLVLTAGMSVHKNSASTRS